MFTFAERFLPEELELSSLFAAGFSFEVDVLPLVLAAVDGIGSRGVVDDVGAAGSTEASGIVDRFSEHRM